MTVRKVMLASDAVEEKIKFPCFVQPKIDGVRGCNMGGKLHARSLKAHRNVFTQQRFSQIYFDGFDGEFTYGALNAQDLCRRTTSAISTIDGEPDLIWNIFDFITCDTIELPYYKRYEAMLKYWSSLVVGRYNFAQYLQPVSSHWAENLEQLHFYEEQYLDNGMEGLIIRDPYGLHKAGRSTVREQGLLRIKRFVDEEAEIVGVEEAMENLNEAQINERGYQFRSSHKENLIGAGRVGVLLCKDLKTGQEIRVTPAMPHDQLIHFWLHQNEIVGKIITYKHFPKGRKDKPRFPIFKSFRGQEDIV